MSPGHSRANNDWTVYRANFP